MCTHHTWMEDEVVHCIHGELGGGVGGAELAGGASDAAVVAVVVAAGAAAGPAVRAEQVGDPRRAAQLPRLPPLLLPRPLVTPRARRLLRRLPLPLPRRPRRRLRLSPRRPRALPGVRVRRHLQPPRHAHVLGARRRLLPHARLLLPPRRRQWRKRRRAPGASVPRRRAPRRRRLRAPRLRARARPRLPHPGAHPPPSALRRGGPQGSLLLLHRPPRAPPATASGHNATLLLFLPPSSAVASGGAGVDGGVVGVQDGGVPAGVRAVPAHLRAPDPALRGDLPHVRRRAGAARRGGRDLRGAPPDPDAAARHEPPVPGVHPLLPRHHHRQPARRPPRRALLQGQKELRQLRRPPRWVFGAAEWLLHVPVRRGEDHAPGAKDRVHRQPVAHGHGAPRQAGAGAGGQHVGERRRGGIRRLLRVQEQTGSGDVPVAQQRRDHAVRLHARQGPAPHHLRLRDDARALDPQQSCSSLLSSTNPFTLRRS